MGTSFQHEFQSSFIFFRKRVQINKVRIKLEIIHCKRKEQTPGGTEKKKTQFEEEWNRNIKKSQKKRKTVIKYFVNMPPSKSTAKQKEKDFIKALKRNKTLKVLLRCVWNYYHSF